MATTKEQNLSLKQKLVLESQPAKVKQMQILTIAELDAISGSGFTINHNENLVSFSQLSKNQKPSSQVQPTEVKQLQTLTISELDEIAGGKLGSNHNETMIKFSKSK